MDDLYDSIINNYHDLQAVPEDTHILCPKVSDDDPNDYKEPGEPGEDITVEEKKKRIADADKRLGVAYRLSLMLGLNAEQMKTWLENWALRVEGSLRTCDQCIRNWHLGRDKFLNSVSQEFDDDVRDVIEKYLNEMDKKRIDQALSTAEGLIKSFGPMNTSQLARHSSESALGLFEALCSMSYLSSPENRVRFNYVFEMTQQKKPLKLVEIIPTMTFFLFDTDPYRNRFATAAWKRFTPGSLKEYEWHWAVQNNLAEAITRVSFSRGAAPTHDKIQNFWEGFLLILEALDEDQIIKWLRGMEVNPSVYTLALEHCFRVDSGPILALLLKALRAMMEKSSKAFWAAYDTSGVNAPTLVEQVFISPAFKPLLSSSLDHSMMVQEPGGPTPALAAWVTAFINNLPLALRVRPCDTILHFLFEKHGVDPGLTDEGRATCILAGLKTLDEVLKGFLDPSAPKDAGTSLVYVNELINLVVKHQRVIVSSAQIQPDRPLNIGRSAVADSIIGNALALDAQAVKMEWDAIHNDTAKPQQVKRKSAEMWQAFSEMLWVSDVKLRVAVPMLTALVPLRSIEQFRGGRNEKLTDPIKLDFNDRYHKMAEVVGELLGHLSGFDPGELNSLCDPTQHNTIACIVALLMHGEVEIRDVAVQLVKAITGEEDRESAIRNMLENYFSLFLNSFCDAVRSMTYGTGSHRPWGPMNPIVQVSEEILNGLCDTSSGILRSRDLTGNEMVAVKNWWRTVWSCISYAFKSIRDWHLQVEKATLELFFRSSMELADHYIAQDGLLASVFSQQKRSGIPMSDRDTDAANARAMEEVLRPPNSASPNIIGMLPIRDGYLIGLAVSVIVKIAIRIKDNGMSLPPESIDLIHDYCKKSRNGTYIKKSNLLDMQRTEILKAIGADAEDTDDDDVQIVTSRPAQQPTTAGAKKQTTVADLFKAQLQSGASLRTNRDDVLELSSTVDKNRSVLDMMKARQASSAKPQKPQPPPRDEKKIILERTTIKEARQKVKAEKAKRDAEAIAKARALRQKTVPGEGSGLRGVAGVHGKDHSAPQKDEMMVGSSSEEEDSEDDDAVIMNRSKTGPQPGSKGRGLVAPKGPVKKVKVQRSAKDMRARLIPPMHVLHQAILEWDIFHDGNDPPNGYSCSNVANTYGNPLDYKQTFFPLLVSEAWRSFVTSKDEATSKPYGISILTRMSVDNFMEVTTSMPSAQNKDRGLSEGDIVIISKAEDPRADSSQPHCLARIFKTTYKKDRLEVIYRVSAKSKQILPVLLPKSDFYAVKITNMITIEREYAALESLQYYDLMDEVLKAQPSPILKFGEQAVQDVMRNYELNTGQAKAILNAKENDGFTLVQGPPGTGKTKTIIAMVGTLLTPVLKASTAGGVAVTRPNGVNPQASTGMAKKLLICAPSNAAVDEIVLRLKAGVKTTSGAFHKIKVLRLGRSDAVNAAVKDVTLDELVNERMNVEVKQNKDFSDYDKMHKQAGELKQKLVELNAAYESARTVDPGGVEASKLQREIREVRSRQVQLGARIDSAKGSGNTYAREVEIKRRQVQQEILDKAQVICSTLSGSGHEMFKNLNVEFETVIIDEAAQCVELSALIPLKYGCSKCILVGDPKQLPPTVLSQSAARYGYDQSLFVRMQHNHPEDVHLLDRQYRMHPEISQFPSQEFYEGRLADGADMASLRLQPWHESQLLGPYRFFDVRGVQSRGSKGQSLVNMEEIKVALQLYERFRADYGGKVSLKSKIGIITPYKAQLFRLRDQFVSQYGDAITDQIEFNTTDAFQGRECEIIIFSCVRASPTGGIGFMTDIRRMNVGLTRAKSSLWILGDSRALVQGEYWGKLVKDARVRDRYTDGDVLGMLSRRGAKNSGFAAIKPPSPLPLDSPKFENSEKLENQEMKDEKSELPELKEDVYDSPKVKEEKLDVVMLESDDYDPFAADEDLKMEESDDYEPPPAVLPAEPPKVQPPPPKPPASLRAPSRAGSSPMVAPPQPMKRPSLPPQPMRRPGVPTPKPQGIGGVDEKGQVIPATSGGAQRPIINPSPPVKKRYLEANSDDPAAKRVSHRP
ncbi:SEN1 N terminal-domain-containing protein [Coniochaeta sp. 2T2.1]|nr:SEN1 N terminal-domain-containing protein [Coniochaeta sp. 2T2.1]